MTQAELSTEAGVTQAYISMLEEGIRTASADQVTALANALNLSPDFFFQPDRVLGVGIGEIFHRRKKSLGAKDLENIHAWMNIKTFAVRRLLRNVEWPEVDLPIISLGIDVASEEDAAEFLRARWYVPSGPIKSVSELLDRAGILTIPTQFPSTEIDAIGQWTSDLPPLLFVNMNAPQDRLRFTLMHEIGHLVLHQRSSLLNISDSIEQEANKFAGAFLMPRSEIRNHLRNLKVDDLAPLKRHWRTSMAAILMRASQLNALTPAEQKQLWIQFGKRGWRKREPQQFDVFGEQPGARYAELLQLYQSHLAFTTQDLAEFLNLSESDVRDRILPTSHTLRVVS